jgi:para-aminobenzoate synthetase component 1
VNRLGNKLISQPIKGTVKRGKTLEEDEQLKEELLKSKKERSENVMIVDLVRNDLSRIAKKGTVQVEELCGCYTFKNLHHLVSTVSCELEKEITFSNILQATFPMGSMTGAPKISAVQHMEKLELRPRGLYSGSFGWIDTSGNFDFNVIIRSVVVSKEKKELTFHVGSAITRASLSGNEFDECMLKAGTTLSLFEQ